MVVDTSALVAILLLEPDVDTYADAIAGASPAVTIDQADIAADAYERYGRGRHPAGLNFGDCFAYALARSRGEPLLFKGNDFALTDVLRA